MTKQLSNQQVADLHSILTQVSKDPKMPLKMCIARNLKVLEGPLETFLKKKSDLFLEFVKTSSEGTPLLDDNYAPTAQDEKSGMYPYEAFQYLSVDHQQAFIAAEAGLVNEIVEIEFVEEDPNRMIYTSVGGEVREIPLRDVIEGPESTITPQMIILFSEYFLKV